MVRSSDLAHEDDPAKGSHVAGQREGVPQRHALSRTSVRAIWPSVKENPRLAADASEARTRSAGRDPRKAHRLGQRKSPPERPAANPSDARKEPRLVVEPRLGRGPQRTQRPGAPAINFTVRGGWFARRSVWRGNRLERSGTTRSGLPCELDALQNLVSLRFKFLRRDKSCVGHLLQFGKGRHCAGRLRGWGRRGGHGRLGA